MDMPSKLLILVQEAMEGYNKVINKSKSKLNTKQKKEKDTLRKQGLYI